MYQYSQKEFNFETSERFIIHTPTGNIYYKTTDERGRWRHLESFEELVKRRLNNEFTEDMYDFICQREKWT